MSGLAQRLRDEAKYLGKGSRLLQRFVTGQPFLLNWQITYRCNFKCDICLFWREPHSARDELTLEQIRAVAETLRPMAPLLVSMAGGEPFLREDLPEIARILSRDHYFTTITNGWYVTPEKARRLYEAGLQDIHVSLDYATPHRHDAQRGQAGAFERAVKAVEILRDARPSRRHRVHLLAVLLDDNVAELEGLVRLARELGVSFELSLYSHRRGRQPMRYPSQKVSAVLADLKARYPGTFVSIGDYLERFDQAIGQRAVPQCHAGSTFFNVDDRGNLTRCIDTLDRPVGNLLRDEVPAMLGRLKDLAREDPCGQCWTGCRALGDLLGGARGVPRLPGFLNMVRPL